MRPVRTVLSASLALVFAGIVASSLIGRHDTRELAFDPPIDALSVAGNVIDVRVQGFSDATWSSWNALTRDTEDDPDATESNLVIFDHPVSRIRLQGTTLDVAVHPIRVSNEPAHYALASTLPLGSPHILSRSDWGADESILLQGYVASSSSSARSATTSSSSAAELTTTGNGSETDGQPANRVQDCQLAQKLYPTEFRIAKTVTTDPSGKALRWPEQYSPAVRLIVIHHTADAVTGDSRPGVERMRALFKYHAISKGWGDIGYHYVIDEKGQIYQGRAGGEYVIGGHAYCNNIGSIGIALMGNFETEQPTQSQMQSLQWLLDTVSKEYDIDLTRNVLFHGKSINPIVGHRDLLSTSCPGYYLYNTLNQVRSNVRSNNLNALITFPPPPPNAPSLPAVPTYRPSGSPPPPAGYSTAKEHPAVGFSALGNTVLSGRPGTDLVLALQYATGDKAVALQELLGNVYRSPNADGLGVWVMKPEGYVRVGDTLRSPFTIPPYSTQMIQLKVRLPLARGTVTLKVSNIVFTLTSEGMRLRVPEGVVSPVQDYTPPARSSSSSAAYSVPSRSSASSSSGVAYVPDPSAAGHIIRILLNDSTSGASQTATLSVPSGTKVNNQAVSAGSVSLRISGASCVASQNGRDIASGIVRVDPGAGVSSIASWQKPENRFRGVIECRIIGTSLTLIDELSLEDYMAGISEEPDTEPAAKQLAFAIAARTYAAYYLEAAHRKFPGQPYDGSDDPATFQKFSGVAFEEKNPRWTQTVRSTAGQILKAGNDVLRIPYFSSDDGRTRSPAEAGWTTFPHAEIFMSKPDPWCRGMTLNGHGVGMSGCGARGQAYEGKTGQQILQYYFPGTTIATF